MKKIVFLLLVASALETQGQSLYEHAFSGDSVRLSYYDVPITLGNPHGQFAFYYVSTDSLLIVNQRYQKLYSQHDLGSFPSLVGGVREDDNGRIYTRSLTGIEEVLIQDMSLEQGDTFHFSPSSSASYMIHVDSVRTIDDRKYIYTDFHQFLWYYPNNEFWEMPLVLVEGSFPASLLRYIYDVAEATNGSVNLCYTKFDEFGDSTMYVFDFSDTCTYSGSMTFDLTENLEPSMELFPNPVYNGEIKVSGFSGIGTYQVYNTLGELQLSGATSQGLSIDVSSLPQGIYWLLLEDEQQHRGLTKFIKN